MSCGKGNPEVQSGNLGFEQEKFEKLGFEHKKFEKHDTSAWFRVFGARLEVKANFGENCSIGVEPGVEATIVPKLNFWFSVHCEDDCDNFGLSMQCQPKRV